MPLAVRLVLARALVGLQHVMASVCTLNSSCSRFSISRSKLELDFLSRMLCAGSRKLTVRLRLWWRLGVIKWCLDSMGWLRLRGVEGSASMRRSVSSPSSSKNPAFRAGLPIVILLLRGAPPAPMLLPLFLAAQRRRVKIVLLGDSGVGKSSLARYVPRAARRRVIDVFSSHSDTIAAAFGTHYCMLL